MLRNLLIGLGVLILVIVAGAYLLPRQVHVERTVVINASAEEIFPHINDYEAFNAWSPWAGRDPDATYEISDPSSGVGATMSWSGNKDVGTGSQTIIVSEPPNHLEAHLDFEGQGEAVAFFDLEPVDGGTAVTWGFDTDMGPNPISRYIGLMLDNWVGGDYEDGLNNLKSVVEGESGGA